MLVSASKISYQFLQGYFAEPYWTDCRNDTRYHKSHTNTVYAISDAATQFSKTAHKSIVAFTFDDQAAAKMEKTAEEYSFTHQWCIK
ncbi:hypothetical protein HHK36_001949 [Tetracentron sinense]|uniref:Uncharacterized protein n=1 Tax=Tetracentron sinense TaxID=13715 RepID=A0A834ZWZ8_TETSI|nr:hypothetical protein HHK36_001949 [Tetracentron sinense]